MEVRKVKNLPTLRSLLQTPQVPLIHRDLSWLQFNDRVLAESRASSGNPLLERLKFLAITGSNLDEFFMIRFAGLGRKISKTSSLRPFSSRHQKDLRAHLLENIARFVVKQMESLDAVTSELGTVGINIVKRVFENDSLIPAAKKVFEDQIFANLPPPQAFHSDHLVHLQNLQMGVWFPNGTWLAIASTLAPVFFGQSDKGTAAFFFLDDLLLSFLGESLKLSGSPVMLRITRDSDYAFDMEEGEDPETIPEIVKRKLNLRDKGYPVRLQYRGDLDPAFQAQCLRTLKLASDQFFPSPGTLSLNGLWLVTKQVPEEILKGKANLAYPPSVSKLPKPFHARGNFYLKLKKRDYLLHHPYDSFDAFVEWLDEAYRDKEVVSIEQTIYRTDAGSRLIEVLKNAAKSKKVRVAIELRARFDELRNLGLADELRRAGVEVAYGFGALKLHAKIALITRRESGALVKYTHLSTGNYNAATARTYTDLAILTSNQQVGDDARNFFDSIFQRQVPRGFKQLVLAPTQLHRRLLTHIAAETRAAKSGAKARIVAKVNALVDDSVIAALYAASQAGVKIDLIVRGACSLIPGVPGLSKNIRVTSIVDRFLEHSRIYYFESQRAMYLSSADWMPRNFYSRLEIAFPILDPKVFQFIETVLLPTYLSDNQKSRELTFQGTWRKTQRSLQSKPVRAQFEFEKMAEKDYLGTPLE